MTKAKTLKSALLLSVFSVLLCVAMLAGTTFAWFTDSVSSGDNKIIAGNLDVELSYKDADGKFTKVTPATEGLFTSVDGGELLWEPGVVAVAYLKVENAGNLALKYQLSLFVEDLVIGTAKGVANYAALSKVLKAAAVSSKKEITYTDRADAMKAAEDAETDASVLDFTASGTLLAGEEAEPDYVALIVYFPSDIGNEVDGVLYNRNDVTLTTSLKLNLVATQYTHEEDSFGSDYDKDAEFPVLEDGNTMNAHLQALLNEAGGAADYSYRSSSITFCAYDEAELDTAWENGVAVDAGKTGSIRMFAAEEYDQWGKVTKRDVYICAKESGATIMFNENCSQMFYNMQYVTKIDFGGIISTENVTNMSGMFSNCFRVEELDLWDWDISNVTTMNQMFSGCRAVKTIYAGDWCVTNPGISGNRMFADCQALTGEIGTVYGFSYAHTGEGGYFTAK